MSAPTAGNGVRRRFIAGAVCPKCAAMDKLVVFEEAGKQYRACIVCDFKELQPEMPKVNALPTRVTGDETPELVDASAKVQRIDAINLRDR